jgi:hypothetical protein
MMRTKRQQAMLMENMNRDAISNVLGQIKDIHEGEQKLLGFLAFLQQEMLAIKNALMRRGVITELEVHQELSRLEELAKMESMAIDLSKPGISPAPENP